MKNLKYIFALILLILSMSSCSWWENDQKTNDNTIENNSGVIDSTEDNITK